MPSPGSRFSRSWCRSCALSRRTLGPRDRHRSAVQLLPALHADRAHRAATADFDLWHWSATGHHRLAPRAGWRSRTSGARALDADRAVRDSGKPARCVALPAGEPANACGWFSMTAALRSAESESVRHFQAGHRRWRRRLPRCRYSRSSRLALGRLACSSKNLATDPDRHQSDGSHRRAWIGFHASVKRTSETSSAARGGRQRAAFAPASARVSPSLAEAGCLLRAAGRGPPRACAMVDAPPQLHEVLVRARSGCRSGPAGASISLIRALELLVIVTSPLSCACAVDRTRSSRCSRSTCRRSRASRRESPPSEHRHARKRLANRRPKDADGRPRVRPGRSAGAALAASSPWPGVFGDAEDPETSISCRSSRRAYSSSTSCGSLG